MSEVHADRAALVGADSDLADRALEAGIALSVVSFALGLLTLVKLVPLSAAGGALVDVLLVLLAVSLSAVGAVAGLSALGVVRLTDDRVRGIGFGLPASLVGLLVLAGLSPLNLAGLLGLVLVLEAVVVLFAGLASTAGVLTTEPAPSAGLAAGLAFGVVGLFLGAAVGGTLLDAGALGYYGAAVLVGLFLFGLAVVPREDLGSALPVATLVGALGLVVLTGTVDLGWTFSPGADVDGEFTGSVVVPLFVVLGSVVAGWGTAKARSGYGARGREFAAYLVVYLNAVSMVAIMAAIVAFVAMKGLSYAVHGVSVGALTALVGLSPLIAITANFARTPAGTEAWHGGARQFLRVVPLAAVGGLAGLLAVVQISGTAVSVPFTYTGQENRQPVVLETAARLTTDPTVGALVVVLVGTMLAGYFVRAGGSLRGRGVESDAVPRLERGLGATVGLFALLVLLLGLPLPDVLTIPGLPIVAGLPVWVVEAVARAVSGPLVVLGALGGSAMAFVAFGALLVGSGSLAERGHARAQVVRIGLYGAMGLLAAVAVLEAAGSASPVVGRVRLVPAAATLGAVAALGLSVAAAVASRSIVGETRGTLRRESTLGITATAALATVVALHVALTGHSFAVGPVTVNVTGTLTWPMTMSPYIPLTPNPGGIMPAVVGTMWLVVGAATFAVPLGVGAAIFLTEYAEQGRVTAVVEVATNALWSTPSIVFGLFGAAFLIPRLGGDESLLSGMLVLGFMLLPLVLITSREAVKSVPDEYRDASAALGVTKWETVKSVVLPAAVPGVITGVILGVGRIAGETAPLILVLGSTLNATEAIDILGGFEFVGEPPFVVNPALLEASAALPTQVWAVIAAGVSGSPSMGWASALVLLLVVLAFYAAGIAARTYFRRKLDHE